MTSPPTRNRAGAVMAANGRFAGVLVRTDRWFSSARHAVAEGVNRDTECPLGCGRRHQAALPARRQSLAACWSVASSAATSASALDQQWLPCCFKGTRPLLGVAQPSTVSGRS